MRIRCGTLALAVAVALVAEAAAAATIGFEPTSQTVDLGDPVSVDIVVSDLGGEIVSAYDLDILYDPGVLSAVQVSFGSGLGDPAAFEVLESSDLGTPGVVDLAQLSLLSDAELLALQGGDEVLLATLSFGTVAPGTTSLAFAFDAVNDIKGANAQVLDVIDEAGSVEVSGAVIPEPSAALLFGIGSVLIGWRRSRTPRGSR